jgi:hypothetical protein
MKQHKFKIIGVLVVLLVAIILGVTLSGGSDDKPKPGPGPGPTPPGPGPSPKPINAGYNPYFLNSSSLISTSKNKVSGSLFFNQSVIDDGAEAYAAKYASRFGKDGEAIKLYPKNIPTGENNEYLKHITYDFSQVDYKITKVLF